ncbi:tryptophanyl-tRNA synthetase [Raineyella antarctica]|uniref:Tryptophan--tRNA ligase n=1 Tax=Raineyella antarctica TaxID=1577474 RepID=A0A1G6H4K2_9ACTN|nr:tryptophan--tRNA ligase [Raineyella antarctica]SDB89101.1 tryptophanyl-tRNA synthetase [Raineyella antarctica]
MTENMSQTDAPAPDAAAPEVDRTGLIAREQDVLAHPERYRILTGDRPTGSLHLGHYLGTLQRRVQLQDAGVPTVLVIADFQVITDREDPGDIQRNVYEILKDYLACGIDPMKTVVFTHSSVPALNELLLPFLSVVSLPEMERNPTVKSELAASGQRVLNGLLLTYPVHQAADILFCKGNLVPVGRDQLPHVEQTRVIARRINDRYAGGREVLPEAQALLSPAPLVLGIDGDKMSKSRNNFISLSHTADETAKLFKKAKTDADRHISYEPDTRPEVSSLVLIGALLSGQEPEDFAATIGDKGGKALKDAVTEAVNEHLAPIRARRLELAEDQAHLRAVLRDGNERANALAEATLAEVKEALGMVYY